MKTVADGLSFFLFNEKINRKMKSKRKLLQLEMCWGIFLCNRKLLRNVPITQKTLREDATRCMRYE